RQTNQQKARYWLPGGRTRNDSQTRSLERCRRDEDASLQHGLPALKLGSGEPGNRQAVRACRLAALKLRQGRIASEHVPVLGELHHLGRVQAGPVLVRMVGERGEPDVIQGGRRLHVVVQGNDPRLLLLTVPTVCNRRG